MIGIPIAEIETPALLIDLDLLERNIQVMADYMEDKPARLRPHFKTNKCPAIAHQQLAAGAKGITCAKVSEAEILAQSGVKDILVANQVVDTPKLLRLAGLARNGTRNGGRISVAVDNAENVAALSSAATQLGTIMHVLVEVDVGMGRCGVDTPEAALGLAQQIAAAPGLEFEGLQAYEGHLCHLPDRQSRQSGVQAITAKVMQVKDYLTQHGFPPKEISGGGTGTYDITGNHTPWTEIQAGSYVFMDTEYASLGLQFQNSLTVLATVIHKRPGVAVTDAGMKVCSTDGGAPVLKGYPHLQVNANEEHGILQDYHDELHYRQKVEYLPSHCCTTVNLHDQYVGVRNGRVELTWPISARGKSQ